MAPVLLTIFLVFLSIVVDSALKVFMIVSPYALLILIPSYITASRPDLRPTQPPLQRVPTVISPGVKWPRREADHSSPSSAEVKNAWSYTSIPLIQLHSAVLRRAQGQIYLYPTISHLFPLCI
jgi:hypothetical protein